MNAPARVGNVEAVWGDPRGAIRSGRCIWWTWRIKAGWRPNRRIRALGYYSAAEFYGVHIDEYLNGLSPLLRGAP